MKNPETVAKSKVIGHEFITDI